jgi:F-type H+-transporting ATPase subunit epsilon
MTFHLRLCTPDKIFFDDATDSIVCPGLDGSFGVLARHLPLIGGLGTGLLKVRTGNITQYFVIDGGMAEVQGDTVGIFANAVFPASTSAEAEEKLEELKNLHHAAMQFA